jgi:hypothetical protein
VAALAGGRETLNSPSLPPCLSLTTIPLSLPLSQRGTTEGQHIDQGISSQPTHPVLGWLFWSARMDGQPTHAPEGRHKRTDPSAATHPRPKFGKPMHWCGQRACPPVSARVHLGPTGKRPNSLLPLAINGNTLAAPLDACAPTLVKLPNACAPTLAAPPAVHQCWRFVLCVGIQCSGPL